MNYNNNQQIDFNEPQSSTKFKGKYDINTIILGVICITLIISVITTDCLISNTNRQQSPQSQSDNQVTQSVATEIASGYLQVRIYRENDTLWRYRGQATVATKENGGIIIVTDEDGKHHYFTNAIASIHEADENDTDDETSTSKTPSNSTPSESSTNKSTQSSNASSVAETSRTKTSSTGTSNVERSSEVSEVSR